MAVPLGFDARFAPIMRMLLDPSDPTYAGIEAGSRQVALRMLGVADSSDPQDYRRIGPPISGPQQSYASASTLRGSGDGSSGQAGQQESSYNSAPYNPTGAPQANSQAELVGQGGRGLAQYQSTPTWTGSVNSQAPPARDEGDFIAPPISGPQFHYWQPNQNPKFAQYLAALRGRRG